MQYSVKIISLLVIVSLLSGVGGYYLGTLSSAGSRGLSSKTAVKTAVKTASSSATSASASAVYNPFTASSSAATNPFDTTSTYENPFTKVKGASTGYVNPFNDFVNKSTNTDTSTSKTYKGF